MVKYPSPHLKVPYIGALGDTDKYIIVFHLKVYKSTNIVFQIVFLQISIEYLFCYSNYILYTSIILKIYLRVTNKLITEVSLRKFLKF